MNTLSLVLLAVTPAAAIAQWVPPASTPTNNLTFALHGPGLNGFIYNSSSTPAVYNYCNMPHVASSPYPRPDTREYTLKFVEVLHRHHKRTPYASNQFPEEKLPWDCSDSRTFFYGAIPNPGDIGGVARVWWENYNDPHNPLIRGYKGNCQFPQLTSGGLKDSEAYGKNIWTAYKSFLPKSPGEGFSIRATANVITSQVASALLRGLYPLHAGRAVSVLQQPAAVDSLQPSYACPEADRLRTRITDSKVWKEEYLGNPSVKALYERLDKASGVNPGDVGWHRSIDHYFDQVSSALCHSRPLPCGPGGCISDEDAETVLRLGQWEYSYVYRGTPEGLEYAVLKMGVWINELLGHLEEGGFRHNVGHDGSMSLWLAVLQVEEMVWPGMGAEVVVEKWIKDGKDGGEYVRILWGGRVMKSMVEEWRDKEWIELSVFVGYLRGLVGEEAREVVRKCKV